MTVKISREHVDHVAELAHLGLSEAEREQLRGQLSTILDYVAKLNELNTSSVAPSAQVIPLADVLRPDVPRASLPRALVLANAPAEEDGYIRVPPVFDQE